MPRIGEIDREATRLHVEHNFSAQVMAEKYTQVYEKVIAMSKEASGQQKSDAGRRKGATVSSVRST